MKRLELVAPSSKSMTQRALVIAALAERPSHIERPLDCDDARHLSGLLEAMGVGIAWRGDRIEVTPRPLRAPERLIFCGNAGTTVRFGAALAALCDGSLRLDGDAHMRRRPMGALTPALAGIGVEVAFEGAPGHLPASFTRAARPRRETRVAASQSSQFASGLLLMAPRLDDGLTVHLEGDSVSRPYLTLTTAMMRQAGATVDHRDERTIDVSPSRYRGHPVDIEPDWSAAAFLLAAGRIAGVEVALSGMPEASLQGDAAFAEMLRTLGGPPAGERHRFDLTDTPDLVAPLAALCLFADHPSTICGVAHARIKECDRLAVLARELAKIGAVISERPDGLEVAPLERVRPGAVLDPEGDHRMAMAFGLVGLKVPLTVDDPGCVTKSFPDFWPVLAEIRAHRLAAS